jgi:triacylglycerol esterase/lipase EstA (alpha/beta hydrolase family)
MTTIRVTGTDDSRPEPSELEGGLPSGTVRVKSAVSVQASRAGAPHVVLDHLQADDVVEVEFQDGLRLWLRSENVAGDFPRTISRDTADGVIELPSELHIGPASRSGAGWAIKSLKILGIDIEGEITDFVSARVERRLQPGPGLYQCDAASPSALSRVRKLGGKAPVLVFLHGTASSTQGSFGDLWRGELDAPIGALLKYYDGRVLAFQHKTLTESPAENAAVLAQQLANLVDAEAEIHLISHSRGGLIGELLARGMRIGAAPITPDELRLFEQQQRGRDVEALKQLNETLRESRLQVTRFVRVACPARGTTLADRRLDRYFSVMVNVASLIPGLSGNPVYDALTSLLAGVLSKRTEPEELPGLESMMPTSPLVRILNRPDVQTRADLHVLGGDLAPAGFWGRLKTFATDLYYRDDHDLVVNTPAMLGGAERRDPIRYWIDTGGQVTHFHYFERSDTSRRLIAALTGSSADFHTLTVSPSAVTSSDYTKRAAADRPVVFVLPGIMGSQLSVGDEVVWMSLLRLAGGGLTSLAMTAAGVAATGLLRDGYAGICAHLAQTHCVIEFPYDWRQPLDRAAEQLRKAIDAVLPEAEAASQPIRLLAHSMGGMVVRAMLATESGQRTWTRMCRHPGSRFIMLGTPNGGSHAMAAMLIGRDALVKKLALLDLRNDYQSLLDTIASFEGVLDLLPQSGTLDLFDHRQWQQLLEVDAPQKRGLFGGGVASSKSAGFRWVVPRSASLARARKLAQSIANSPLDPARTVYVAGVADETACDLVVDLDAPEGRRVKVLASSEGDGRVLWQTGIPRNVRTFYMDTIHGDLASDSRHFPAIVDLLSTGSTSKLATRPPARRAGLEIFEMREVMPDMLPDQAELVASALGGRRARHEAAPTTANVRVRIVHDNLTNACHPVLVGHYQDDVIVAGEQYLDQRLAGRLSELLQMGLYPGAAGTGVVVVNDSTPGDLSVHPGAVIAGLGMVGELSPGRLTTTLAHAMTLYGSECVGRERRRRQQAAETVGLGGTVSAPLTAVLVGSGEGGLTLADCVQAAVRAVAVANRRLSQPARNSDGPGRPVLIAQIDQLDVVELFEDRAIGAVHALRSLGNSTELEGFLFEELLVPGREGQRRAWYAEDQAWWQRLRITTDTETGALRFEAVTQAARARAELRLTQRRLVEGLVEQAIQTTGANRDLGDTLFELLVPTGFKPSAPDRRKLAIVMDAESAALPWELLHDRFDTDADPLSVSSGMIRQLLDTGGREQPLRPPHQTAMVVGNPHVSDRRFPPLPGAAGEAIAVTALLRDGGYEVVQLLEQAARPMAVFAELHRQPWRILHLAAHGVFEFRRENGDRPISGLVLDDGLFFTAAEAEQMRFVPDLVFINCCHLGQTAGEGQQRPAYHKLAANLGTQFIRMGARAVIAAGWEVNDAAAKTFAASFYRGMLNGALFGDAVIKARKETYQRHAATNTWGAYQCYGDPSFSLVTATTARQRTTPAAQAELQVWLDGVAASARQLSLTEIEALRRELDERTSQCPAEWWMSARLLASAGSAYAQVGWYEQALKYLEKLPTAEQASAPISTLELLANCRTRIASELLDGDQPEGDKATALLEEAESLLENLIGVGKTAERCSLMGAVMKRRCMLPTSDQKARRQALTEMQKWYGQASELSQDSADRAYALANRLAADVVLSWRGAANAAEQKRIRESLETLQQLGAELAGTRTDFFSLSVEADRMLLAALAASKLDRKRRESIERKYREALARGVAVRHRDSMRSQFAFLRTLAAAEAPARVRAGMVKQLGQLEQMA